LELEEEEALRPGKKEVFLFLGTSPFLAFSIDFKKLSA